MSTKGKRFPRETLTENEIRQLLATISGNGPLAVRNRAVIALLWRSGLRISEALALRPSDVSGGAINVRSGKGSKQRTATYDSHAEAPLTAWLLVREGLSVGGWAPLFCSVSRGRERKPGAPINPSYFRQLLPKLASEAGIAKRVHPHCFRHTHAAELANERLPLPAISTQLGHASTATTAIYVQKLTAADLQDAMSAIGRSV
jgi:site-specific recombinase XerD